MFATKGDTLVPKLLLPLLLLLLLLLAPQAHFWGPLQGPQEEVGVVAPSTMRCLCFGGPNHAINAAHFGSQQYKQHLLTVAVGIPHVTFSDIHTQPPMVCYNMALQMDICSGHTSLQE